ncbi:N-acetyltransferase DgcN [Rhodovibrionaceae bacterium A322]
MAIQHPYLLFLGDAPDQLAAKTAAGVAHWRPEWCLGQLRFDDCKADLGLTDMSLEEAWEAGARTLILGVANRGGLISEAWMAVLEKALIMGYDIASGLHNKLTEIPALAELAKVHGRLLVDVRHPTEDYPVASGKVRSGKRLLPVGTDCSVGKMYTALAVEAEMHKRGMKATFRATGQTGIFIAGEGVSVDAVVADFISGAVETICPANDEDHWDIVEGQGSLFHASYAGVTIGLIHGAQPDALVLCHEPSRPHMRGLPDYKLPELGLCMERNLQAAQLTNPDAKFVGISVNTSSMSEAEAADYLKGLSDQFGLPAVDPVRNGVASIVDQLS